MLPKEIEFIRRCLPDPMAFPYFADRESPWLLARRMDGPARVGDLRGGPLAKFLARPAVRPVVAACGGRLNPADLHMVANPAGLSGAAALSAAARAGLEAAYALPWHDFELTVDAWGIAKNPSYAQMSRPGGNIVLQMGFPSDHAALMGRYLGRGARKDFEFNLHPIRQTGRPTLAWARLDVDLDRGVALIEEVQSDWLRYVHEDVRAMAAEGARSRELRVTEAYDRGLRDRYGKIWPRAMLMAALHLAGEVLGCRDVWMHRPGPGAVMKGIRGVHPPRSLYSSLPKSFGFRPEHGLPPQLQPKLDRTRQRALDALAEVGEPLFWRMSL